MDNKSLQVFNNGQISVRSVCDNGEIWFVARDIATALEYKESSVDSINKLMAIVPEIWKGRKRFLTPGGEQEMLCLTEQGVYFFLGRSDKPKAQPYQIWIAQDVVPSIRKTGNYSVFKDNPALPKGKSYAVVVDAGKAHSDGTPIRQIKWNSGILNVIQDELPFF